MTEACDEVSDPLAVSTRDFARFAQFIKSELGIKMPESKIPMLQSRLMRRMRDLEIASISQYCDYLFSAKNAEEEIGHFINAVTTNKTDFFREPQHFDFFSKYSAEVCRRGILLTIHRVVRRLFIGRRTLHSRDCAQ